jgi:chemotaxis protein MotB
MSRGGRRGHGGGGHHGGSWKVAYADFVTSMMALFLVLWLVGSDQETRLAVQRYFRGEINKQGKDGTQNYSKQQPFDTQSKDRASRNLVQQVDMKRELQRLREQLNTSSENGDDLIRYEFLADGVRITVIDSSAKPFFDPGTAHLTSYGQWVLKTTAWYLDRFPFQLEVEGHTQKGAETVGAANPAGGDQPNQNWDISTTRAIAARDTLQDAGLQPERFWRVIGYSDRVPLDGVKPEAEENRRITIVARLKPDEIRDLTRNPTADVTNP